MGVHLWASTVDFRGRLEDFGRPGLLAQTKVDLEGLLQTLRERRVDEDICAGHGREAGGSIPALLGSAARRRCDRVYGCSHREFQVANWRSFDVQPEESENSVASGHSCHGTGRYKTCNNQH